MKGDFSNENNEAEISFDKLVLPLIRVRNLFMIECELDSFRGNFILDTGAPFLVLNSTYFRNYPSLAEKLAGGITGAVSESKLTQIGNLNIGEMRFQDLYADMIDLGHIESQRGVKILGLLGLSLFNSVEIQIDVLRSQLIIYRLNPDGSRALEEDISKTPTFQQSINPEKGHLIIEGKLNKKKLFFYLDTGAEANVLSNALPKEILENVRIIRRSALRGADGNRVEVLYGSVGNLEFSKHKLPDMNTIITNLNYMSRAYNVKIDGMLGYDFLAQGIVNINFIKKQLYFYAY